MDLLDELLNGHGGWVISIARECRNSQAYHPDLAEASEIFGEPLVPDRVEYEDARLLRISMAGPADPLTKHLGEAETIAIISRRNLDGFFLTDDVAAMALAARHGIKVVTTWDLLRLAHKVGKVTKPVLVGYLRTLGSENRGSPPGVSDPEQIDHWL